MVVIDVLLLLLALVCFGLAAARRNTGTTGRTAVDLVALGLAFWVVVPLLDALQAL